MSWVAAGVSGVAGIASGLIGSSGAKDAAGAAKKTAKRALHLQRDMYQDQVKRGEKLTANQIRTIRAGRDQTQSLADAEKYRLGRINRDERDMNARLGEQTARANAGRLIGDRSDTLNALAGDRDANIRTLTGSRDRTVDLYRDSTDANLRAISGARDASLGDSRRTQAANILGAEEARDASLLDSYRGQRNNIRGIDAARDASLLDSYRGQQNNIAGIDAARDRSIANFQPALGLGNNALSAFGAELGLGSGPEGWGGLSMTPGAQFRLNEGYRDLQGTAAAQGGLNSGATLAAMEEYRQGLASTDRDAQMAQLMALGGVGQNAASNIANIDMGAAGDIAAQRNYGTGLRSDLRTGAASQVAAQRNIGTGLRSDLRTGAASEIGGYREAGTGLRANLRSGAASQIVGARQWGAQGESDALRDYGGAIVGERNYNTGAANNARQYYGNALNANRTSNLEYQTGVNSDFARAQAQREVGYTDRATNSTNNYTANMGAARSNMMSGGQQAAQGYATGGANALASIGDAGAAAAAGAANAWNGGIENGFKTFGFLTQNGMQNPLAARAQQNVTAANTPPPMARPW